jgi:hypothetical protein
MKSRKKIRKKRRRKNTDDVDVEDVDLDVDGGDVVTVRKNKNTIVFPVRPIIINFQSDSILLVKFLSSDKWSNSPKVAGASQQKQSNQEEAWRLVLCICLMKLRVIILL